MIAPYLSDTGLFDDEQMERTLVRNFRFEIPGRIARSAAPDTPEGVDWLYEQGIRTVVSLHPISDDVQARLRERGIRWEPFLITSFTDGVPGGLGALLKRLDQYVEEAPVLIHCQGGGGRAGTIFAAYLIHDGLSTSEAFERVTGVERDDQKAFLSGFATAL